MRYGADGNPMRMQAIEQVARPFNRHPVTGELLWFCNIHNHARYLRDRRPCTVPEVGMTEVFYGDLSPIPAEDLDHINEVSQKNIRDIPMQPGDDVAVRQLPCCMVGTSSRATGTTPSPGSAVS